MGEPGEPEVLSKEQYQKLYEAAAERWSNEDAEFGLPRIKKEEIMEADIPTTTVGPMENFSENWLASRERDLHMRKRIIDNERHVISEELMWVTRALSKKREQRRLEDSARNFGHTINLP